MEKGALMSPVLPNSLLPQAGHAGRCRDPETSWTPTALRASDASCSVDLGAAYVHGCNITNSVWRLAACSEQPLDTRAGGYSIGWGEDCRWRSNDGRVLDKKTVRRAFEVNDSHGFLFLF